MHPELLDSPTSASSSVTFLELGTVSSILGIPSPLCLAYVRNDFFLARLQWLTPVILATQEDHSLKLALANSSRDYLKKQNKTKQNTKNHH
jgi:hypothetical protein